MLWIWNDYENSYISPNNDKDYSVVYINLASDKEFSIEEKGFDIDLDLDILRTLIYYSNIELKKIRIIVLIMKDYLISLLIVNKSDNVIKEVKMKMKTKRKTKESS